MADSETETTEVAAETAPVAQPASTPEPTVTLKQMQAADAARVRAQQEAKQAKDDLEATRRELAARDEKDLSDLERAQKERDRYKTEAENERTERVRAQMALKYPHAVADLEGEPLPSETALEKLEARATATVPPAPEPEPRIDTNNPRKQTAPATPADPRKALEEAWIAEAARIRGF